MARAKPALERGECSSRREPVGILFLAIDISRLTKGARFLHFRGVAGIVRLPEGGLSREGGYSSGLRRHHDHLRVRRGRQDALHAVEHPRRSVLEVPSVLHGQAEAHGYGRPCRALPAQVQAAARGRSIITWGAPPLPPPPPPTRSAVRRWAMLVDKLRQIEERSHQIERALA